MKEDFEIIVASCTNRGKCKYIKKILSKTFSFGTMDGINYNYGDISISFNEDKICIFRLIEGRLANHKYQPYEIDIRQLSIDEILNAIYTNVSNILSQELKQQNEIDDNKIEGNENENI